MARAGDVLSDTNKAHQSEAADKDEGETRPERGPEKISFILPTLAFCGLCVMDRRAGAGKSQEIGFCKVLQVSLLPNSRVFEMLCPVLPSQSWSLGAITRFAFPRGSAILLQNGLDTFPWPLGPGRVASSLVPGIGPMSDAALLGNDVFLAKLPYPTGISCPSQGQQLPALRACP